MNRVIFETVGNVISMILFGFLITIGYSFDSNLAMSPYLWILTFIFLIYSLIYLLILYFWNRKQGAPFSHLIGVIHLHRDSDERESNITLKASRAAYATAMVFLPLTLGGLMFTHFFSSILGWNVDMYTVGCWLIVSACIAVNVSFSVAWCSEFRK